MSIPGDTGDYEQRFRAQVKAKTMKLRALHIGNEYLQKKYNEIIAIKSEVDQMKQYIEENKPALQLVEIYDALGFAEGDPNEDAILQRIYDNHLTATEKGYTWDGSGYVKGERVFGIDWVRERLGMEVMG